MKLWRNGKWNILFFSFFWFHFAKGFYFVFGRCFRGSVVYAPRLSISIVCLWKSESIKSERKSFALNQGAARKPDNSGKENEGGDEKRKYGRRRDPALVGGARTHKLCGRRIFLFSPRRQWMNVQCSWYYIAFLRLSIPTNRRQSPLWAFLIQFLLIKLIRLKVKWSS